MANPKISTLDRVLDLLDDLFDRKLNVADVIEGLEALKPELADSPVVERLDQSLAALRVSNQLPTEEERWDAALIATDQLRMIAAERV